MLRRIFVQPRRSYAKVVNVFGRRNVDTSSPSAQQKVGFVPEQAEDVSAISGVPEERVALIHSQTHNGMQNGTFMSNKWKIEFDQRETWENPLMSWESGADTIGQTSMEFLTKEDAIMFCTRMGYKYEVHEKHAKKPSSYKSYAENFTWNKKTRIPTK